MVYEWVIFTNNHGITSEWISMDKYHVHFHEQFSTPSIKGNAPDQTNCWWILRLMNTKLSVLVADFNCNTVIYLYIDIHSSTYFYLCIVVSIPRWVDPYNIARLTFTIREELTANPPLTSPEVCMPRMCASCTVSRSGFSSVLNTFFQSTVY